MSATGYQRSQRHLEFEKETKNSIRYLEPDDVANKPVENLYIKKSAFQCKAPSEIQVRIDAL